MPNDRPIRVLHAGYRKRVRLGIANQLRSEFAAAASLRQDGIVWHTQVFANSSEIVDDRVTVIGGEGPFAYHRLRQLFFSWLRLATDSHDIVLLRYPIGDPWFLSKRSLHPSIFTIHHTFEPEEARINNRFPIIPLKALIERIGGQVALRRVRGIVGITAEISAYEEARSGSIRPKYVLPNGVLVEPSGSLPDERVGVLKLVMVASAFSPWHGLDLVLRALKSSIDAFQLHIVGSLTRDLEGSCQEDERIVVHGRVPIDELRTILSGCDLGLSSFGLHRNRMSQACTLKVRDYLAQGLPVYSGHVDPAFPGTFPYYRCEESFDIDNALLYAAQLRAVRREEIRDAAYPYIDKASIMRRLVEDICHAEGLDVPTRRSDVKDESLNH